MSLKDKNSKPIVHIATDEKFIDTAYDIYERAFPGKNKFIILLYGEVIDVKHLSSEKEYVFIQVVGNFISEVKALVKRSSLVVFHGLDKNQGLLANNFDKNDIKFLWSVFGYEVYNNYEIIGNHFYGDKTYKKFIFSYPEFIKNIVRPFFYKYLKRKINPNEVRKKSLKKMDYVGLLYEEELNKYKELQIVKSDTKLINFTYYPLELVIDINADFVNANHILLGNSASYTNNHLEAFEILENFDLENHNIITPLSYGNTKYANQIIEIGKEKMGGKFKPLTNFLPLGEYQKIIQCCGIVIMNHYRQQAVGNVLNSIFLGAKVYLSNRNTLYNYLRRIGCHVYCIEKDLVPGNQTAFDLLNKSQMNINREILMEELSLDRIVSDLQMKLSPIVK